MRAITVWLFLVALTHGAWEIHPSPADGELAAHGTGYYVWQEGADDAAPEHPLADWPQTNNLLFGVNDCTNGADDIGSGRYLDYDASSSPGTYISGTGGVDFTSGDGDMLSISGTDYTTFLHGRTTASVACWARRHTTATSYPMSGSNTTAAIGFQGLAAGVRGLLRNVVTATATFPADEWHHIVCTFENGASPDGRMYMDGEYIGGVSIPHGSLVHSVRYVFGGYAQGSGHFDGELDDPGIWSSVLTSNEVFNFHADTTGTKQ